MKGSKAQDELGLKDVGISDSILQKAKLITDLLPKATSLSTVSEFLKQKKLSHSAGSWEEMYEKRIVPNLRNKKITIEEFAHLLSQAEEFGRCHVFLYSAKRKDIERHAGVDRMKKTCERLGYNNVFDGATVVDLPSEPTLTEIREENSNGQKQWVFKIIETRQETVFLGESSVDNKLRKEWTYENVRAVNVARLHESGFLEIRIQSHRNSTQYQSDVNRIWKILKDFLPPTSFREFSLGGAKKWLLDNRDSLKEKIRFSDSTMRNTFGNTIVASTGTEEADLFKDKGMDGSIDCFLGHGAYCDSTNIWWRPVDEVLNREVHMILSGLNNEFAIPANCMKFEYEYVLNELRVNIK
jgi:hypothetical protein